MPSTVSFSTHLALIAVQIFFSSLSVVGKEVMRGLPWQTLGSIRIFAATLIFALFRYLTGKEPLAKGDHKRFALYGFLGVSANQLQFLAGLSRAKAIHASVLGSSIPVFATVLAIVLGRESFHRNKALGVVLALGGAVLLTLFGSHAAQTTSPQDAWLGNLLILSNSFCYALYLVLSRQVMVRYSMRTVACWMFLHGSWQVLVFDLVGWSLFPTESAALVAQTAAAPTSIWLGVAYVVLFSTVATYALNSWALQRAPTSLVAIYIYLQPVITTILAFLRLGEQISLRELAAAILIFVGVSLVGRANVSKPSSPEVT